MWSCLYNEESEGFYSAHLLLYSLFLYSQVKFTEMSLEYCKIALKSYLLISSGVIPSTPFAYSFIFPFGTWVETFLNWFAYFWFYPFKFIFHAADWGNSKDWRDHNTLSLSGIWASWDWEKALSVTWTRPSHLSLLTSRFLSPQPATLFSGTKQFVFHTHQLFSLLIPTPGLPSSPHLADPHLPPLMSFCSFFKARLSHLLVWNISSDTLSPSLKRTRCFSSDFRTWINSS